MLQRSSNQQVDALVALQVDRKFTINLEVKLINTAAARIVSAMNLQLERDPDTQKFVDGGTAQLKAARARAGKIIATELNGKEQAEADRDLAEEERRNLEMVARMMEPLLERRRELEAQMCQIAESIPCCAAFVEGVPGLKFLGLAVILGEAGDLSRYPNFRHVWKRLGLAPFEGKAMSTHRMEKSLSADEWIAAGYSPRRLGQIVGVVTVPFVMHKAKSKYGKIYEERRAHTLITHPEWYQDKKGKPKLNPKTGEPSSERAKRDAQRIMTKALIKDFWLAWTAQRCVESHHDVGRQA